MEGENTNGASIDAAMLSPRAGHEQQTFTPDPRDRGLHPADTRTRGLLGNQDWVPSRRQDAAGALRRGDQPSIAAGKVCRSPLPLDNSFFAVLKVCWRKRMQALREQGKLPTHFARLAAVTYLGADARTRRATRGVLTPVLTQVQSGC